MRPIIKIVAGYETVKRAASKAINANSTAGEVTGVNSCPHYAGPQASRAQLPDRRIPAF